MLDSPFVLGWRDSNYCLSILDQCRKLNKPFAFRPRVLEIFASSIKEWKAMGMWNGGFSNQEMMEAKAKVRVKAKAEAEVKVGV